MSFLHLRGFLCSCVVVLAVIAGDALGASQRSFVASTGADVNPCSLSLPCRTFAVAIAATLPDGEVIVLDSAGYGPVSISQNVSIIAPPGIYAGISVPGPAPGIQINGARVVLEGLTINGTGGGTGISVDIGGEVHITNCAVTNLSEGIRLSGAQAFVHDTELRDSSFAGMSMKDASTVVASRVRALNNLSGVIADHGFLSIMNSVIRGGSYALTVGGSEGTQAFVTVHGSLLAEMTVDGATVTAAATGSIAMLDVFRSTLARNTSSGVSVAAIDTGTATVTVADSTLAENGYAIQAGLGNGSSTTLANRNLVTRNVTGGLRGLAGGVLHTRSNNSGEQVAPTSGTTPVAGF